ncbi:unnamed protein product, partial [Vitis vinifera]|uniref:Uncharacterized protein n=1 Tax=Vitis vinifera TaxID=29760 RepID=D7TY02_VITVI
MPINCQCNDPSPSNGALMLTQNKIDLMNHRMNKHLKKTGNFVHGIQEHGNHLLPLLPSIFSCSVWLVGIS